MNVEIKEPVMDLVRFGKLESDVDYLKRDVAEIKVDLREMRRETNARFGQLSGEMNARFDRILGETNIRFDRISGEMRDNFDKVDAKFDKVDVKFGKVDSRFDQVDQRFDAMQSRMQNDFRLLLGAIATFSLTEIGFIVTLMGKLPH